MTRRVEFAEWSAFQDTFAPYRVWKLLDALSDIEEPDAELFEVAPDDVLRQEDWGLARA
jgi:hypothetical protein